MFILKKKKLLFFSNIYILYGNKDYININNFNNLNLENNKKNFLKKKNKNLLKIIVFLQIFLLLITFILGYLNKNYLGIFANLMISSINIITSYFNKKFKKYINNFYIFFAIFLNLLFTFFLFFGILNENKFFIAFSGGKNINIAIATVDFIYLLSGFFLFLSRFKISKF